MIADNVKTIREKIEKASLHTGENVTLVGVTKTRSADEVNELVRCGVNILGENRAQEFRDKYPLIEGSVSWHIIGSLQPNKLKYIIGKADLIQSVDSVELAEAIDRASAKAGIVSDVLMEVNISGEESKHGFSEGMISEALEKMSVLGEQVEVVQAFGDTVINRRSFIQGSSRILEDHLDIALDPFLVFSRQLAVDLSSLEAQ